IEGRKQSRPSAHQYGLRGAGYRVVFAITASPSLLNVPVRELAECIGVGKSGVSNVLRKLEEEGLIGHIKGNRVVLDRVALLRRWVEGYADAVRPKLFVGRFRTADKSPTILEHRIEKSLDDRIDWAFGGTAGAYRLVPHYRGEQTVLHLAGNAEAFI